MTLKSETPKILFTATAIAFAMTTVMASKPVWSAESIMLEEIVVTANKREQNVQDVGTSVTAFSGAQVRELGYTNTIDIAQQTPALNIIQFHPSVTTANIRGISQNEFADHLEGPIAIISDNAYVSSMGAAGAQMFDVGRVEVLRGPQGTLFGRNATGGLIHYVSAAPTEEFEGYFSATIGNYGTKRSEGAVSGALSENLQGRLSISIGQNDGTLENLAGNDLRDTDALAIRAQLAWQPSDALDITLKLHHAEDDSRGNGYQHDATFQNDQLIGERIPDNIDFNGYGMGPGTDFNGYRDDTDVWTGQYDDEGFFKREISGATVNLSWDMSNGVSLTSVTDYLTMDKDYREDADSSPYPFFHYESTQEFDQVSQELRLNGSDSNFQWQTGIYYLNIDTDVGGVFDLDLFTFGEGTDFGQVVNIGGQQSTVETNSWAVFAQGEWELTEAVTAIIGVRYSDDERDVDYLGSDNFYGDVLTTETGAWDNFSYKAQLDWRPTQDTLYFAGITRTHKAGNFRLGIGYPNLVTEHDEEVLTSFETGMKTEFNDGQARLNANLFYYDYEDYQAFVVDPTGTIASLDIVNVDANATGAEVELTLVPADGLDILLGASWMDSEVMDIGYPDGTVSDSELPFAPGMTLNGLVRYQWDVGEGSMSAQIDFNYVDDFCFSVLCAPLDQEDSYWIGNARLKYSFPNNNWSITAFVNNFSEEKYRIYSLDLSGLGVANDTYSLPRMYGITLDVNF